MKHRAKTSYFLLLTSYFLPLASNADYLQLRTPHFSQPITYKTPVNLHGKCLLTTDLKKEDYEEVIHFKPAANEIKRKFVITNGDFVEKVKNGTMYIDCKDLANFILTLGLKQHLSKSKDKSTK